MNTNYFEQIASRIPLGTTCGITIRYFFESLTGSKMNEKQHAYFTGGINGAANRRTKFNPKTLKVPSEETTTSIVGIGVNGVGTSHVMMFAVLPDGSVTSVQTYFPVIHRAHCVRLSFNEFKSAVSLLAKNEGKPWTKELMKAYDTLTNLSCAYRDMSIGDKTGFFMSPVAPEGFAPGQVVRVGNCELQKPRVCPQILGNVMLFEVTKT